MYLVIFLICILSSNLDNIEQPNCTFKIINFTLFFLNISLNLLIMKINGKNIIWGHVDLILFNFDILKQSYEHF